MIDFLFLLIAACPFCQPTETGRFQAAVYAAAVIGHSLLFDNASGLVYYGSAAIFDAVVVCVLARMAYTALGFGLMVLSLVSFAGNFLGWVLWVAYFPPDFYNNLFVAIYCAAIVVLTIGGHNVGGAINSGHASRLFASFCEGGYHGHPLSREEAD